MPRRAAGLAAVVLGLLAAGGALRAEDAEPPPEPSIFVAFERLDIQPGETLTAELWLANRGPSPLSGLRLRILSPGFLHWRLLPPGQEPCAPVDRQRGGQGGLAGLEHGLSDLAGFDILRRRLCVTAADDIREGAIEVRLVLAYGWDGQGQAFAVREQSLKASLFTIDQVGGISLSLATFFVPGLLFIFGIRMAGAEVEGHPLFTDKTLIAVGSLLLSTLLTGLATLLPAVDFATTSRAEFLGIAGAGLGGGWICGHLILRVQRRRADRRRREREELLLAARFSRADSHAANLIKLFEASGELRHPVARIELGDGSELIGTLTREAGDEQVIAGWFELPLDDVDEDLRRELVWDRDRCAWVNLLERVEASSDLGLEKGQDVQRKLPGQDKADFGDCFVAVARDTVRAADTREAPLADAGDLDPVVLTLRGRRVRASGPAGVRQRQQRRPEGRPGK